MCCRNLSGLWGTDRKGFKYSPGSLHHCGLGQVVSLCKMRIKSLLVGLLCRSSLQRRFYVPAAPSPGRGSTEVSVGIIFFLLLCIMVLTPLTRCVSWTGVHITGPEVSHRKHTLGREQPLFGVENQYFLASGSPGLSLILCESPVDPLAP